MNLTQTCVRAALSVDRPRNRCSEAAGASVHASAPPRAQPARFSAVRGPASRKRRVALGAIASDPASATPVAEPDQHTELVDLMMQRLDKDLKNLFTDVGIDQSNYDNDVVRGR